MLYEEIMIDEVLLEQRVADLERVVTDLQLRLTTGPDSSNWLDKVTGSISDEPAFLEALAYGRTFRMAGKPADEPSDQW